MCGVAGIFRLDGSPVEPKRLSAMTQAMKHRGPDDEGHVLLDPRGPHAVEFKDAFPAPGPSIGLGHRRLSILDLSPLGHQPMRGDSGKTWLSYNGEIYNYPALKTELEREKPFRSKSDTEVILRLYEKEGVKGLERLEGIFALVLIDQAKGRVVMARDRYGVKPLYLYQDSKVLVAASEIKGLFASGLVPRSLDRKGILEHFTFQWCLGERTCFKDVELLPHGTWRVYEDGRLQRSGRFGGFDFGPGAAPGDPGDLLERIRKAAKRQLLSDVPVGSYLSGGMDTGVLSVVAAGQIPELNTFTCGFLPGEGLSRVEQTFDERDHARFLSGLLKTRHHEITLGPDYLEENMDRVAFHLEEPRVGICYQNFAMAEEVRKSVTVVLSGVGGDELFAGYPWRYGPILEEAPAFEDRYYAAWIRFLDDESKRRLFRPEFLGADASYSTRDAFVEKLKGSEGLPPLHRALKFDAETFLQGLLLVEDRMSMAHSVESRVPLLDETVVRAALKYGPPDRIVREGEGFKTKVLLRRAMEGFLPPRILSGVKVGFTPPEKTWFRGRKSWVRGRLLGPTSALTEILFAKELERILEEHESGLRDHRQLIWSFLVLESVMRGPSHAAG